jgi:hypothetical protein
MDDAGARLLPQHQVLEDKLDQDDDDHLLSSILRPTVRMLWKMKTT